MTRLADESCAGKEIKRAATRSPEMIKGYEHTNQISEVHMAIDSRHSDKKNLIGSIKIRAGALKQIFD